MARRKKGNLNTILIALALVTGTWIAADWYYNVRQSPQREEPARETITPAPRAENKTEVKTEPEAVAGSNFVLEKYADERFGIEFLYPVAAKESAECPKPEKTEDGFTLGMFSFAVSDKSGTIDDFIAGQLEGMNVDERKSITVAGKPATRVEYQTAGMGWYGSDTFVENGNRFYEFGLLANETGNKCGGADDYEDQVYQSVLSTLKFTN
ncbi:MAG: hypothetical protein MUD10_02510 [Candidatus Pacebacteria bacterium]|nr:hypothetical protein [Candidatus Paceibacterota bacterium]